MSAPLVSIIVPTLDRPTDLERFLRSADRQDCDDYEVLVIDQGATSVAPLTSRHRNVRYVHSDRKGLSHARNLGIQRAAGRLFVFADDDSVLEADYMDALKMCASRLSDPLVFGYVSALNLENNSPVVTTFRPGGAVGPWRCDTLCSISLVFSRSTFDTIDAFDERFGLGASYPAGEETDLLPRMMAAGGRGMYLERPVIRHPVRGRTADLARRYETYGFAHGALARKHARNRIYLARFGYGLARTIGALMLAIVRSNGLAALYRASLRGKLRGFRSYAKLLPPLTELAS